MVRNDRPGWGVAVSDETLVASSNLRRIGELDVAGGMVHYQIIDAIERTALEVFDDHLVDPCRWIHSG